MLQEFSQLVSVSVLRLPPTARVERINFPKVCNILCKARVLRPKYEKQNLNNTTMDQELKDVLMPVTIFGGLGGSIYFFTKVMTDYVLKKKMIEKGFVNDDTQAIFKQQTSIDNRYSSLKWGLIMLFAGLSLVVMEYIPTYPESPLPYGLFAVFVSIGFLIYYFMVKKENK
jgi:hypothetical protein